MLDAPCSRDPRADRAGGARQGFRNPRFQSVLLLTAAAAPFMAEAHEPSIPSC